jgi:hypothetical protein
MSVGSQLAILFAKHDGAEAPGLRFGQQLDQVGFGLEAAQIDEFGAQLARQRLGDAIFGDVAAIDENAPKLAPAALLFFERQPELLVAEQPFLYQQITQAYALRRPSHRLSGESR